MLKCATVMALHSCRLGAPSLHKEARGTEFDALCDENSKHLKQQGSGTPAIDKLKGLGQWNDEWNEMLVLDPIWTEEFIATGIPIYMSNLLSARETALLSVAIDGTFTHMVAQRHIRNAMKAGATIAEILDVLKLCVAQGVQACNLAIPILVEELANRDKPMTAARTG